MNGWEGTELKQGRYAVLVVFILSSLLLVAPGRAQAGNSFAGAQPPSKPSQPRSSAATQAVTPMVAAAQYHTCSLFDTGVVKCWGWNSFGQLGNGTDTSRNTPADASGFISDVLTLTAGGYHTCALLEAGVANCWGYNGYGQLGDGTASSSPTPVQVSELVSSVLSISAGTNHTCAVLESGAANCWGSNGDGQVGSGTTGFSSPPVQVSGLVSGVASIVAGPRHTCALLDTGAVKCWGRGTFGQLGNSLNASSSTPVQVSGLVSGVVAIAVGGSHTCALQDTGAVKCWGYNLLGQLGDSSNSDSSTPVQVTDLSSGVIQISAGEYYTCALLNTGAVKCWGYNNDGQLGNSSNSDSPTPVQVTDLSSGVLHISAGFNHACALLGTNAVKCWGYNGYGQLGNGVNSGSGSSTPVGVMFYRVYLPIVVN
jgi:alpha-tubulin suppressor-like RCC1 family protein